MSRSQRLPESDCILQLIERWKKYIYPDLPGEPVALDEFTSATDQIVKWRNQHQELWPIGAAPLSQFKLAVVTRVDSGNLVGERELIQLGRQADDVCNQIKALLTTDDCQSNADCQSNGNSITTPETLSEPDKRLSPSRAKAYSQFLDAVANNAALKGALDHDIYDWLKENGDEEDGELPAFDTWSRYLRHARKVHATNKNRPRRGRTGRSIVRNDAIDADRFKNGQTTDR